MDSSGYSQAFVSSWNGSSWSDQEIAGALNTGHNAVVFSVSCGSTTFCAVGGEYVDSSGYGQAFVSTGDGSTWRSQEVVGTLNYNYAKVNSMSCVSATFCVAAGQFRSGSTYAFASKWNGSIWTDVVVANSLNPFTPNNYARSVSCVSSDFCVVVGRYRNSAGYYHAFASDWNGSAWSDVDISSLSTTTNVSGSALAVSCVGVNYCVAGGMNYYYTTGLRHSFISTWTGSSWSDSDVASSLNTGEQALSSASPQVNAVACVSASFCVAGGQYVDSNLYVQAFLSTSSKIAPPVTTSPSPFVDQNPLSITNSVTSTPANQSITLTAAGGSGVIDPLFGVSGAGCVVNGDVLRASIATTCVIIATNASNGYYAPATSTPVNVHFTLVNQRELRLKATPRAFLGGADTIVVTGGSGRGELRVQISGAGCVLHGRTLTATEPTRCTIVAHKRAFGIFRSATSSRLTVTFVKKA